MEAFERKNTSPANAAEQGMEEALAHLTAHNPEYVISTKPETPEETAARLVDVESRVGNIEATLNMYSHAGEKVVPQATGAMDKIELAYDPTSGPQLGKSRADSGRNVDKAFASGRLDATSVGVARKPYIPAPKTPWYKNIFGGN